MSRLTQGGGPGQRAAFWAACLGVWAVGSTLFAQPSGSTCGCSAPCGCSTAIEAPGATAYPYYGDYYGEDGTDAARDPYGQGFGEIAPGQPSPYTGELAADVPSPAAGQPPTDLQLSQQFGGGGQFFVTNYAPPSIGDSFTPGVSVFFRFSESQEALTVPLPSGSAVLGRAKLADNNSPLPRDRIFFDYNYFHNATLIPGGIDVHRYAPGFESTFLDGMMSIEMRVPIASTVNSDLTADLFGTGAFIGDIRNTEIGNVQFMWKTLLVEDAWGAIGTGIAVSVPTADDVTVSDANGTQVLRIENEAVHLMPYLAALRQFGPNVFFLSSAQLDFGTRGNPVFVDAFSGPTHVGDLDDQTLLYLDSTLGAWVYRNPSAPVLNGLALVAEAHYTTSLEDMPTIITDDVIIGDPGQTLDMVNLTCGAHLAFGRNLVTVGYGFPVSDDRVFDGELRFFVNRFY